MLVQFISTIFLVLLITSHSFTPEISHLSAFRHTTTTTSSTKRILNYSKSSNANPKKKDYQQYGEIDPSQCTLTKEEVIQLITERKKARRARDFQKADTVLSKLNSNNVFLNDSQRLWRADGGVFDVKKGYKNMEYEKSPLSKFISTEDEEYVMKKLQERSKAKFSRNFDKADDILDELKFMKNVVVDDDNLTWKVVDHVDRSFGDLYTYGGKRLNNVSEEEIIKIEKLVKMRSVAKTKKDYDIADQILHKLEVDHGVRVDDTKKLWFFLPKFDNNGGISDRERRRKERRSAKRKEMMDPRKRVSDWTVVEDDPMPGGISIAPDEFEPMHEVDNNSMLHESESVENLSQCTIPVLKEKLKAAGLPVSGRKAELIDRLMNA